MDGWMDDGWMDGLELEGLLGAFLRAFQLERCFFLSSSSGVSCNMLIQNGMRRRYETVLTLLLSKAATCAGLRVPHRNVWRAVIECEMPFQRSRQRCWTRSRFDRCRVRDTFAGTSDDNTTTFVTERTTDGEHSDYRS